jgi:hypothetical protein
LAPQARLAGAAFLEAIMTQAAYCLRCWNVDRWLRYAATIILATGLVLLFANVCLGDDSTDITKVEEYWQVDLDSPDVARGAPQLNFVISPAGNANGLHAVFVVNQRDGAIGGLQLQLWNGESLLASSDFSDTSALASSEERLTWKTRLSVTDGTLTVEIVGLDSTTWGNFSTSAVVPGLSVSTGTTLTNLNNYNLNVSAENFGVDFGNTRVTKVMLKKVVSFTGNQKSTDQLGSEKVVYSHP